MIDRVYWIWQNQGLPERLSAISGTITMSNNPASRDATLDDLQDMGVNGGYRGHQAILKKLDEVNFCVSIEIASGPLKGRIVDKIQYEDISKIY